VGGVEAALCSPMLIKRYSRALGRLGNLEHRLFLPLSFQLQAAILEETDRQQYWKKQTGPVY